MHPAVAKIAVLAKVGRAKRGMAVTLAVQLDDFRKLIAALCNAPLPPTINAHLVLPVLGDTPVLPTINAHLVQMAVTENSEASVLLCTVVSLLTDDMMHVWTMRARH